MHQIDNELGQFWQTRPIQNTDKPGQAEFVLAKLACINEIDMAECVCIDRVCQFIVRGCAA